MSPIVLSKPKFKSLNLFSWNVNGVRSVGQKGFFDWIEKEKPDVVCLQETKAQVHQLDETFTAPLGYQTFWHSAKKPGYSGVAVYSKIPPNNVTEGLGFSEFDNEGRVINIEYDEFVLVNAYFPNSQRDHARLRYKLEFCDAMLKHCEKIRKKSKAVVLCGDYNIAHQEIDLKNPKTNMDNAGFLPEEREWMTKFLAKGYVDTFRDHFPNQTDAYSWWSYRPGIRERNIGWRLDYFCVNAEAKGRIKRADIHPEVKGSDHCPVSINFELSVNS